MTRRHRQNVVLFLYKVMKTTTPKKNRLLSNPYSLIDVKEWHEQSQKEDDHKDDKAHQTSCSRSASQQLTVCGSAKAIAGTIGSVFVGKIKYGATVAAIHQCNKCRTFRHGAH